MDKTQWRTSESGLILPPQRIVLPMEIGIIIPTEKDIGKYRVPNSTPGYLLPSPSGPYTQPQQMYLR